MINPSLYEEERYKEDACQDYIELDWHVWHQRYRKREIGRSGASRVGLTIRVYEQLKSIHKTLEQTKNPKDLSSPLDELLRILTLTPLTTAKSRSPSLDHPFSAKKQWTRLHMAPSANTFHQSTVLCSRIALATLNWGRHPLFVHSKKHQFSATKQNPTVVHSQ